MPDRSELERTVRGYAAALVDGDAARCAGLSNQTLQYHQALFLLIDFHSLEICDLDVVVNGTLATATFSATIDATSRGVRSVHEGRQVWTLLRTGDTWRVDAPLGLGVT